MIIQIDGKLSHPVLLTTKYAVKLLGTASATLELGNATRKYLQDVSVVDQIRCTKEASIRDLTSLPGGDYETMHPNASTRNWQQFWQR